MDKIIIYGKPGCAMCEAAKEKVKNHFKLPFVFVDLEAARVSPPSDWRELSIAEAMGEYQHGNELPWLRVGGEVLSYPAAMKALKRRPGSPGGH